jgi:hypothetical protein
MIQARIIKAGEKDNSVAKILFSRGGAESQRKGFFRCLSLRALLLCGVHCLFAKLSKNGLQQVLRVYPQKISLVVIAPDFEPEARAPGIYLWISS